MDLKFGLLLQKKTTNEDEDWCVLGVVRGNTVKIDQLF
jgi:hypothetical protein